MFGNKTDNDRFEVIYKQSSIGTSIKVLRDKQTGVNYIYNQEGYSGGICVLVDKEGKPIVT